MSCRKCGGSGDIFEMKMGALAVLVPFREMSTYKLIGYEATGNTICCSLCNGLGEEDI